ncbi:MAG: FAD-dependent oxidoreductase [Planctomycetota bacterium]
MASPLRLVVIGGVAAGLKAACKAARLDPQADITVLERSEIFSYAGCGLPYYVSGVVHEIRELYSTPIGVPRDVGFFRHIKRVNVMNRTEAVSIDREEKVVHYRQLLDGAAGIDGPRGELTYDKLLIATGAAPIVPPIPGADLENVYVVKTVEDAKAIQAAIERCPTKKAVIVGGGLIGVEMAECLANCAYDVTMVEMLPHILPMLDDEIASLVEKHLADQAITIHTATRVTALEGEGGMVKAAVCGAARLEADIVILAVGIRPRSELAREAGLEIGPLGGIKVDAAMRTSDPDIFAAGDCVETVHLLTGEPCYIPLGSTANKQGRVAAMNICGQYDVFPGVLGSVIVKVCDFNVACTGLSERNAIRAGFRPISCLCPMPDRSHYYPEAKGVLMKLVADADTGKLLGVQAVGPGEVAKRVDAAVPAITAGMTVEQVSKLDLCYAPPYASAMDNLITAANVLRNKLEGRMQGITQEEVKRRLAAGEDFLLLDARSPAEVEAAAIRGATNIPLGKVRQSLDHIPKDKPIVCFCQLSLRGYEASLMLKAAGYQEVRVMDGGIAMWPYEIERGG